MLNDVKRFFISENLSDPYSVIHLEDKHFDKFKGFEGVEWPKNRRSALAIS